METNREEITKIKRPASRSYRKERERRGRALFFNPPFAERGFPTEREESFLLILTEKKEERTKMPVHKI